MKKISSFLFLALCASLQLSAVNKFLFAVGTRTFKDKTQASIYAESIGLKPRKAVEKILFAERSTLTKLASTTGKHTSGKMKRKPSNNTPF